MSRTLIFWLLLSAASPAFAAPWDLTTDVAKVKKVELRGQLIHWSLSSHLLCPASPAPQEPLFSGCVDLTPAEGSKIDLAQVTPGCVVVNGTFERYGQVGERFLIPSGDLMSEIGVVSTGSRQVLRGR